eukprot:PhF_6_TR42830/c0_g1_i1/m.64855
MKKSHAGYRNTVFGKPIGSKYSVLIPFGCLLVIMYASLWYFRSLILAPPPVTDGTTFTTTSSSFTNVIQPGHCQCMNSFNHCFRSSLCDQREDRIPSLTASSSSMYYTPPSSRRLRCAVVTLFSVRGDTTCREWCSHSTAFAQLLALYYSYLRTKPTLPLVVLYPPTTPPSVVQEIRKTMPLLVLKEIQPATNFDTVKQPLRPQVNKLNFLSLTEYDRTIWIDSDVLFVQSFDGLCDPHVETPAMVSEVDGTGIIPESAEHKVGRLNMFHTGLMVFDTHPDYAAILHRIVDRQEVHSYNKGDTGVLWNWVRYWYELPSHMMLFKWNQRGVEELPAMATRRRPHVIHYLGRKPHACGREGDCNELLAFDCAFLHKLWWCMYDLAQMEVARNESYIGGDKTCRTFVEKHLPRGA